jgi:hypothetical protein
MGQNSGPPPPPPPPTPPPAETFSPITMNSMKSDGSPRRLAAWRRYGAPGRSGRALWGRRSCSDESPRSSSALRSERTWMPIPTSSRHALGGAKLLLNLSASNDTVTKPFTARAHQAAAGGALRICLRVPVWVNRRRTSCSGHAVIASSEAFLPERRIRRKFSASSPTSISSGL